jgi:hypothetical protein
MSESNLSNSAEEVRKTKNEDVLWIPEHVGGVKSLTTKKQHRVFGGV